MIVSRDGGRSAGTSSICPPGRRRQVPAECCVRSVGPGPLAISFPPDPKWNERRPRDGGKDHDLAETPCARAGPPHGEWVQRRSSISGSRSLCPRGGILGQVLTRAGQGRAHAAICPDVNMNIASSFT